MPSVKGRYIHLSEHLSVVPKQNPLWNEIKQVYPGKGATITQITQLTANFHDPNSGPVKTIPAGYVLKCDRPPREDGKPTKPFWVGCIRLTNLNLPGNGYWWSKPMNYRRESISRIVQWYIDNHYEIKGVIPD